jgi:uncharacterized protein (DUF488 family)
MPEVWTVGHWICPEAQFTVLLQDAGIELLVDVRAHPGSRRNPQFSRDAIRRWLRAGDIDYVHMPDLGGRRGKRCDATDVNCGWENVSFKNYADYSLTDTYEQAVEELTGLARERPTAIMCAEPMPWRCHRLLISNTLTARGWTVWHLMVGSQPRKHELGRWGAVPSVQPDGRVTYPR